jgi:hypothetical protein
MTAAQWRQRAEAKERNRQNASHERHMQVLAVAKQIRKEMRDERKHAILAQSHS